MEGFNFMNMIWVIIFIMAFVPMFKQSRLQARRLSALRNLEKKRGSRVIALIHRQEMLSLFGIPLTKYINIEDSEQILRAIRLTPDDMPIDLILHTPGGLVLASDQIAQAIHKHPAKVTVFVPHYAMSGGTMIALAADEIVMDPNAVLGPVDPQIDKFPAASLIKVTESKDINHIDDETLILADIARKAAFQVKTLVTTLMSDRLGQQKAEEIADLLSRGSWTHDYPIGCDALSKLGLQANDEMHREIYEIMDLFPQPIKGHPSVSYVPLPYEKKNNRSY